MRYLVRKQGSVSQHRAHGHRFLEAGNMIKGINVTKTQEGPFRDSQ